MTHTIPTIAGSPWPKRAALLLTVPISLALCSPFTTVWAGTKARHLQQAYEGFQKRYGVLAPHIPLSLHSTQTGARIRTEVYGTVHGSFADVAQTLSRPEGYCEFLPPLLNLKTCIHYRDNSEDRIRFYVGGKRFMSPIGTIHIVSILRVVTHTADDLHVRLSSVNGDVDEHGYRVDIEIAPFGKNVLARVYTDYNPDRLTRMAVAAYVRTFASDKIGFTRVPGGTKGEYVRGMSGIIERNTVRAFLAMQAYLDTLSVEPDRRYEARLQRWFGLTEQFPEQLHEMNRADYLSAKRREHLQQLRMQRRYDKGGDLGGQGLHP